LQRCGGMLIKIALFPFSWNVDIELDLLKKLSFLQFVFMLVNMTNLYIVPRYLSKCIAVVRRFLTW
jgi:hypothetical protein